MICSVEPSPVKEFLGRSQKHAETFLELPQLSPKHKPNIICTSSAAVPHSSFTYDVVNKNQILNEAFIPCI
jgi:hypothetical protein